MKTFTLIFLLSFVFGQNVGFGQTLIQSTCETDSDEYNSSIEDFAYEIALSEMKNTNHYLHDSILVPKMVLDSIKRFIAAYHNAIDLSDFIVDYRKFNDLKLEWGTIHLTFDNPSNCISQQNNSILIKNDTLKAYIDSLGLDVLIENANQVALLDTNDEINVYADFNFFNNVSCITNVELILAVADQGPCYTSRSGFLRDNKLYLKFMDYNYCGSNAYSYKWEYAITRDCKIEILDVSTSALDILNNNLDIYPNPFDNKIHFKTERQIETVNLFGIEGSKYRKNINLKSNNIETSDLPKGVYIIEIEFKNKNIYKKKMIKK